MVLLKATKAVKAAVNRYNNILAEQDLPNDLAKRLSHLAVDDPLEHKDFIELSKALVQHENTIGASVQTDQWRLDTLLRGTSIYVPPPRSKTEPTAQYKALMQKLRQQEEQRQYERMIAPSIKDSFGQAIPVTSAPFNPQLSHGREDTLEVDEVTFQDINRQLTLIINVLVTVIASSVTIWFAARYWAIPQRLALALIGSLAIAIAEVVVYMGYIRRVKESKAKEKAKPETKEVSTTWVIESNTTNLAADDRGGIRHRKGKHR